MAYTTVIGFELGASKTGLTLNFQLRDTSNSAVGSAITTGYYERAAGEYMLVASIPDGHQGWMDCYTQGSPGTIHLSAVINPPEAENSDVKTSTRSDGTGVTLADDAITAAKFDETTAYPIASADSGSTQIARTGADGDTLETLSDQIDLVSGGGGAIAFTYTLTDDDTGYPIDDALIEVCTDEARSNAIASGRTNASGVVTFYLDAGTYYLKRSKSGYNFTNQDITVA